MATNGSEISVEHGDETTKVKIESPDVLSPNTTPKRLGYSKNAQYHGTGKLPCPNLGENWMIEQIVRQQGKSAGRYDTYYYSPNAVRIRSKLKLQEYTGKDLSNFDYNSGKFLNKDTDGEHAAATKQKKSLLKTEELKTIDRVASPKKVTPPKSKVKGPYNVPFQNHEKRKDIVKLKLRKTKKKNLSTTEAIQRAIAIVEKDDANQEPLESFQQEARSLMDQFPECSDNFEDLIMCAWNFLSIESKMQFSRDNFVASEAATTSLSPLNVTYPAPNPSANTESETLGEDSHCRRHQKVKKGKKRPRFRSPVFGSPPTQKRKRCGICKECLSKDCGECAPCKDMKKFGGTGCKKQGCLLRKCQAIHSPVGPVSMVSQSFFNPFSFPQPFLGSMPMMDGRDPSTLPQSSVGGSPLWPRPFQTEPSTSDDTTFQMKIDMIRADHAARFNLNPEATDSFVGAKTENAQSIGIMPPALDCERTFDHSRHLNASSSSNNSLDSNMSSEQNGGHKFHKRKSRVPVYIRQVSEEECDTSQ